MGKSAIEWTQHTNNSIAGCNQVSPGCANCYAKTIHDFRHRLYLENDGKWSNELGAKPLPPQYAHPFETIQLLPERLAEVTSRKTPTTFFMNSVADLFHKDVPLDHIKRVFNVMNASQQHTFQVLTKRDERLAEIALQGQVTWTPNIWQGVSIENNRFVERADSLRAVPSYVRFISAEPLLSSLSALNLTDIHWVIVGGESGRTHDKKIRPMHPRWIEEIRLKAAQSRTHFFFKQWGNYYPAVVSPHTHDYRLNFLHGLDGSEMVWPEQIVRVRYNQQVEFEDNVDLNSIFMARVGKKKSGRIYAGQTWDAVPIPVFESEGAGSHPMHLLSA